MCIAAHLLVPFLSLFVPWFIHRCLPPSLPLCILTDLPFSIAVRSSTYLSIAVRSSLCTDAMHVCLWQIWMDGWMDAAHTLHVVQQLLQCLCAWCDGGGGRRMDSVAHTRDREHLDAASTVAPGTAERAPHMCARTDRMSAGPPTRCLVRVSFVLPFCMPAMPVCLGCLSVCSVMSLVWLVVPCPVRVGAVAWPGCIHVGPSTRWASRCSAPLCNEAA
mmetsp:Transcript_46975/g.117121  ORF Transcript_46975/g.117121 Transcript_46975/m.117121 type:complete len:218 (+) Transcript_46975:830-1483(+)